MDAAPFPALRYHPAVAGDLVAASAPSYDEVEPFAYAEHRAASPYTVLELLAPPSGFDTARETLERWLRTGVLVRDPEPAFYCYEEHELRGGRPAVQRGVLAAVELTPLGSPGGLLPHENIDTERARERLARLEGVSLDVSPVFALTPGMPDALRELLDRAPSRPPVVGLTDERGVDHRVWRLDDPEELVTIRASLAASSAVIADGHHRYAAALAFRDRQRQRVGVVADAPWERTLAYLVDARTHGPRILPIHRLVRGLRPAAYAMLARTLALEPVQGAPRRVLAALDRTPGTLFGVWRGGQGALAHPRDPSALRRSMPEGRSQAWLGLDLAVLEHAVLPGVARSEQIEARSDLDAAVTDCDADASAALFLLRPVGIDTVVDLALGGERMPAKSTSFRPKPRTGLVMREAAP